MILVTGVNGQLGSGIFNRLKERDVPVIGGSRAMAAGIRRLDFDEPQSIHLAGITTLVLVSAGYAEDDQVIARHRAVIDAAVRDGVQRVIYTSLAADGDFLGFALAHRATERIIRESGIGWTFLRNGIYAELFGGLLTWADSATIESAFGTGALAAVARDDLAEAAAVVAASPSEHDQQSYDLVGEPMTAEQVAKRLDAAHRTIGIGEYRNRLLATEGLLPFQPPMLVSIATSIRHGFLGNAGGDLRALIGRPATDPVEIAAQSASLGRPA